MDFACKTIDFKDLVRCSFSLNKTEYGLLMFLLEQNDSLDVSSIGELLGKDRTTMQKAMKKLVSQDLVEKHQVNLEHGGYTFVYKLKNKELLKQKMLSIVDGWYSKVQNRIKEW